MKTDNKIEDSVAPRRSLSLSITGKLTLLYTLSAFAMLATATGFWYWVVTTNFERENNQFLADKIYVLRDILGERPNDPEALEEEIKWEGAARRFAKYYTRILDGRGLTLIETPGMADIAAAPGFFSPPLSPTQAPGKGVRWQSVDGKWYLLMAAWAELGSSPGKQRLLQVAMDVSHEEAFIARLRQKLAVMLVLGILFSAGAGVFIARKGMRPLEEITRAAQQITATRLHARIGSAEWPKELTALAAAFDGMLNRLEGSFTRLSQFSADLAHELRTPINRLRGEAEVTLSRTRTVGEYQRVLESSLEEYVGLSRMIDSLLFLARADNREIRIERSQFDAREEMEAVREFYDAMAEEQGLRVSCQGNAVLNADPILFRRAVSNLLCNAIQYTPPGGEIALSVQPSEDHSTVVRVRDTGSGIDPGHGSRVFDRFYRGNGVRSQYPQGIGLGLAIVKSVMDLHGGTVTLQSEPAQGTTFTLKFPFSA